MMNIYLQFYKNESNFLASHTDPLEELVTSHDTLFKCLETVKILWIEDILPVLVFSKLVLSTAPMLEKLVIEEKINCTLESKKAFLEQLERIPKMSKKAQIFWC